MVSMLVAQGGVKTISTTFKIKSLTSSVGYDQITDKPTHIINNFMSCNDLTFCTKSKCNLNSCSWCFNFWCHHNTIYGRISIYVPYYYYYYYYYYVSSVFFLSALFWEFLMLGIFINNNSFLELYSKYVFKDTHFTHNPTFCFSDKLFAD